MEYKLYTLVDITNTDQHRAQPGNEHLRWKEQNFQTLLQTIGIRANIAYNNKPQIVEMGGRLAGFNTDEIIRLWRFDFRTEREFLFEQDSDPVALLKSDFHLVPYINGLDELMEQNYAVFVTAGPAQNIVFYQKQ